MALFRSIGAALDADGTGTEPSDTRKGLAGLFSGPGVLPGGSSPLVVGTDGFGYQVNAAHWVTSRGGSDGVHLWGNDGPIVVTTDVAPGAGLSRIDIIYALHPSNGENADTSSQPVVAVAKGVAASTPIAPAIPTGALELARNTMTSSATDTAGSGNTLTQTAATAVVQGTNRARVLRRRTTATPIPNATWTELGGWSQSAVTAGAPSSDFTGGTFGHDIGFDGWVRVRAMVTFDTNSAGARRVRILQNGSVVAAGGYEGGTQSGSYHPVSAEYEGPCASGDAFRVEVYQNSGATLSTSTSGAGITFFAERTA